MNEINNNINNIRNIKFTSANAKQETGKVDDKQQKPFDVKEYKEAAAAPAAEQAGRSLVRDAQKADNTENDVMAIMANPAILNNSEALFRAAEMAGVPYPEAATFATSELR